MKKWHMEGIMSVANAPRKVVFAERKHFSFDDDHRPWCGGRKPFFSSVFHYCQRLVSRCK